MGATGPIMLLARAECMHYLPDTPMGGPGWIVEIFKVYGRCAGCGIKFPTLRLAPQPAPSVAACST